MCDADGFLQVESCAPGVCKPDIGCTGCVYDSCVGDPGWSRALGGPQGTSRGNAVLPTSDGGLIVVGELTGTVDLGGGPVVSAGDVDGFVTRYGQDGEHLWSWRFGGPGYDAARGAALTADGNILVTGGTQGGADFGDGPTTAEQIDTFVVELTGDGEHVRSRVDGGPGKDHGLAIAVDADVVAVVGSTDGNASFGGDTFRGFGGNDIFVAVYDRDGAHLWSTVVGSTDGDEPLGLAADGVGGLYLTGTARTGIDFGGGQLQGGGGNDVFVAKYSTDGRHAWSNLYGNGYGYGFAAVVDGEGNLLLAGGFWGTIDFGAGPLEAVGGESMFLASLTPDGDALWATSHGVPESSVRGIAIATDPNGDFFVAGSYIGPLDFGLGPLPSFESNEIFVGRFTGRGDHVWSQGFGDFQADQGLGVARRADGGAALTGYFSQTVDFGGRPLSSPTESAFVAVFGP